MRNTAKLEMVRAAIGREAPVEKLTAVAADLLDADSWHDAMVGVEYVMHVASPFFASLPKDPDDLIVPAREGTLNVLMAATTAGVKRVIITSSMAAVAYGIDGTMAEPMNENRWTDPDHHDTTPYTLSKYFAERVAWDYVEQNPGAPELVTVNPAAVLGPLLTDNPSDSLLIVSKMLKGEFPGLPKIGFELVDVRDVAVLHLLAMEKSAAAGQRFLATGGFRTMAEIAAALGKDFPQYAKKLPGISLPDWLLRIAALFDKDTRGVLNELGKERRITSAKAKEMLGWLPRPPDEAIHATAGDMIRLGLV